MSLEHGIAEKHIQYVQVATVFDEHCSTVGKVGV
jgi:hypothetical protein